MLVKLLYIIEWFVCIYFSVKKSDWDINIKMKIAFLGPMCSGKTTCCNYIKQLNNNFEIIRFAGKVYDICYDLFEMIGKDRLLLQSVGENMRNIDKNVWINYLINNSKNKEYLLLDDLRYENELVALRDNGWTLVKLKISNDLQVMRIMKTYSTNYEQHINNMNHESEIYTKSCSDDIFDYVINIDTDTVNEKLDIIFNSCK
jgi:hypothetical protein